MSVVSVRQVPSTDRAYRSCGLRPRRTRNVLVRRQQFVYVLFCATRARGDSRPPVLAELPLSDMLRFSINFDAANTSILPELKYVWRAR
jgi:hypothetical protein